MQPGAHFLAGIVAHAKLADRSAIGLQHNFLPLKMRNGVAVKHCVQTDFIGEVIIQIYQKLLRLILLVVLHIDAHIIIQRFDFDNLVGILKVIDCLIIYTEHLGIKHSGIVFDDFAQRTPGKGLSLLSTPVHEVRQLLCKFLRCFKQKAAVLLDDEIL
ncbi:unknown [Erysipelotrichaceae bacterium CAG:64]|nr:unknown [Erysipelotrichaceae bacterium CAG:64]